MIILIQRNFNYMEFNNIIKSISNKEGENISIIDIITSLREIKNKYKDDIQNVNDKNDESYLKKRNE